MMRMTAITNASARKTSTDMCSECEEGGLGDPEKRLNSCYAIKEDHKNEVAREWEWYSVHGHMQSAWRKRISQEEGGRFVEHAKAKIKTVHLMRQLLTRVQLLRKGFGLKAMFIHYREPGDLDVSWPGSK